jgi:Beta-lactamase enzyme family
MSARPALTARGLVLALLIALATMLTTMAAGAAADTTAATDDRSVSAPTGWWTYSNVTADKVGELLNQNGARLTDVEVYSATANTFTVTMVKNAGDYWVPGWWWYFGQTKADVKSLLATNNARLIDIEPYNDGTGTKFAVVMISNTGSFARTTAWDAGVSEAQLSSFLNGGNWRLQDLESYTEAGVKKYAYLAVENTGSDGKAWELWLNQTPSSVASKVDAFHGRITNLERQSDGTYNFIQVKNTGSDDKYWRFYFGLPSLSYTAEVAGQFATRVMDIEIYTVGGVRKYDAVMIDNADAATRRITNQFAPTFTGSNGLPIANFGAYLKRVGGGVAVGLQPDRRFEPASAIKAVVNLHVMRLNQANPIGQSLNNSFTYYDYPNDPQDPFNTKAPKDKCTIASDETAANMNTSKTVDWGKDQMMAVSDNRTTRGFILRYGNGDPAAGLTKLNATAQSTAGMWDTLINQDQPGCGWMGGKKNRTTLADLGRLYEGVENSTLLTGDFRDEFYQPMNGGTFQEDGGLESSVIDIVEQEAAKQNKTSVVSSFVKKMDWRIKGGSYDIGCDDGGCAEGKLYFRSLAGRITLPVKTGASTFDSRAYVFGRYVDSLNLQCTGCIGQSSADMTLANVTPELFREIIASALQTW